MKKTCVLAYSGGLDTSAIIPWIKDNYDYDVIAFCSNVGNLPPENELRQRALELGAKDFVYEDAQDEFVADYVNPMLRSGATYFDDYLLGTSIARPIIAERVARFVKKIGAEVVAHGATGKGNDHIRFERTWAYLIPKVEILAPWKVWSYRSREDIAGYLRTKGFPWDESKRAYSVDLNAYHRSCEGGVLEDIEVPYEANLVKDWLKTEKTSAPQLLKVGIEKGIVTSINGAKVNPSQALEKLNELGSLYGIGLCDIVEERFNGIKSHGVYETPGGTLAHLAIRSLKQICWSRDLYLVAQTMADQYGKLIYDGLWFSDARSALEKFFEEAATVLTGEVQIQLDSSLPRVVSRKSAYSLYNLDIASFESDNIDIHRASLGYTKILTLPSQLQGLRERELRS